MLITPFAQQDYFQPINHFTATVGLLSTYKSPHWHRKIVVNLLISSFQQKDFCQPSNQSLSHSKIIAKQYITSLTQ